MVAFDSAQRRVDEAAHIERLEDRIRSRRVVFAAVLQIMRGHGLSETDAFTLIRQTAMRHRTTIESIERGNHRGRRNAEPDAAVRVAIAALKIVDTLHAGRGHPRPGRVERARQIDRPASGLDKHSVEAEPAGVQRGIIHAIIGG